VGTLPAYFSLLGKDNQSDDSFCKTPLAIDHNQKAIFFYVHKRIITGEPRANVRVDIPRLIVRVDRAGAAVDTPIPVAA
jgi:hypothetical protein